MLVIHKKLASRLVDIEEDCVLIEKVVHDNSVEQFFNNPLLQNAVLRSIGNIGEATRSIIHFDHKNRKTIDEYGIMDTYPEIPWRSLIGARERSIHGYDDIDFDIVCDIMENGIPELLDTLRKIKVENPELQELMEKVKLEKDGHKRSKMEKAKNARLKGWRVAENLKDATEKPKLCVEKNRFKM